MRPELEVIWRLAEAELFTRPSTADVFNPYRDVDVSLDREDAAAVRRANLRSYFTAYGERPRVLILAEAPGPWGCRFSGVPITSEAHLLDPVFPFGGEKSSSAEGPYSEYSARIFWRVLEPHFPTFFVWNAVPLHPHRPGAPTSIRTPRVAEVRAFASLTEGIVDGLRPERILGLGRKAEAQLTGIGVASTYVRHPSQGGAKLFEQGMREVFGG